MAFDADNLALVGYGNGKSFYLYNTTDATATVAADAYIAGTGDVPKMAEGDIILATCGSAAAKYILVLGVKSISSTSITFTYIRPNA